MRGDSEETQQKSPKRFSALPAPKLLTSALSSGEKRRKSSIVEMFTRSRIISDKKKQESGPAATLSENTFILKENYHNREDFLLKRTVNFNSVDPNAAKALIKAIRVSYLLTY